MSAPDPEGFSWLAKVLGAAAAVITPLWGAHKYLEGRFDRKADKVEVDRHRDYFVKVFEQMREHQASDAEHFSELKDTIHRNHAELLREIGRKADR